MTSARDPLAALPATFTTAEAERARLWRHDLYRLRDAGVLMELSRGVYRKADAPETAHIDLLAITRRVPSGVVCLISALSLFELTDEVPVTTQIAVPRGAHRPQITYPPAEVLTFDKATFDLGRDTFEAAPDERIDVYGPARSVVDAMRLRSRVGEPLALRALRLYLGRRGAKPAELLDYARALDVEGPVRQAVEAVLS